MDNILEAARVLESRGHRVTLADNIAHRHRTYLAGSDDERADEVNRFLRDPQYDAFFCRVRDWLGVRALNEYGPVPLGFVFSVSSVSVDESIAMLTEARLAGSEASALFMVSTTVLASGAATEATEASDVRATAAVFSSMILSSDDFTSAESKSLLSANFTPVRSLRVTVFPSLDASHDWARPGTTLRSLSNSVSVP